MHHLSEDHGGEICTPRTATCQRKRLMLVIYALTLFFYSVILKEISPENMKYVVKTIIIMINNNNNFTLYMSIHARLGALNAFF